jgi:hypothetical protein
MDQEPFLSDKEMQMYSVGGGANPDELKQKFMNLIENLVRGGESNAILFLGRILNVPVNSIAPNQLIDAFNKALNNPEEQAKALQTVKELFYVLTPAIKEASQQSAEIFGDTLQKFSSQGMSAAANIIGMLPVIGESEEALRVIKNFIDAGETGAAAAARLSKIGADTANKISEQVKNVQNISNVGVQKLSSAGQSFYDAIPNKPIQGGKRFNQYKKLQTNSLNRISNALKQFQSTRRKKRGTKRAQKLSGTRSKRFKKTRR